jgi:hypothetical protein
MPPRERVAAHPDPEIGSYRKRQEGSMHAVVVSVTINDREA